MQLTRNWQESQVLKLREIMLRAVVMQEMTYEKHPLTLSLLLPVLSVIAMVCVSDTISIGHHTVRTLGSENIKPCRMKTQVRVTVFPAAQKKRKEECRMWEKQKREEKRRRERES